MPVVVWTVQCDDDPPHCPTQENVLCSFILASNVVSRSYVMSPAHFFLDFQKMGSYRTINSTKFLASGASNFSDPRLMSEVWRVREVVCA